MLHFRPTLVSKPLILRPPIFYLLPLPPHHCPLLLAVLLRLLPPSLTPSGFSNGMLEVSDPGALNYFTFSHPILLTLSASRNPILTHLSSFRIPGFSALRLDRTHSRSGILSPDATHASGGVITFVRQGLSFSELSTFSLSSLDLYSDYVGINITLNNFSSLSFLNVHAPPIRYSSTDDKTDFFSPFFPPPEISLFWALQLPSPLLGLKRYFRLQRGRKYSTGSYPLTFSPSMTLTYPPFSITLLAIAPSLAFPLLPPLSSFLLLGGASGPGF